MADVVMRSREGDLFEVAPEDVATLERDRGYVVASDDEVFQRQTERERFSRFGSAGQQAQGLAETFLRNATLGAVKGLDPFESEGDTRARAQVVEEESPILNTAAAVAPAVAAGVLAGGAGAGLAATVATEAAIGGAAGYAGASDAAWRHDQELSAEAAWGSFAGGALLGAGGAAALRGASKVLGATRNRFVEASGKAARKAEQEALAGAGVVRPVEGLTEAIDDPVKAAALRKAAGDVRHEAQQRFADELGKLDEAEAAARRYAPDSPDIEARSLGLEPDASGVNRVARQRVATRQVIDDARRQLEPIASPEARTVAARSMEALDRAESSGQIHQVARAFRAQLDEALDAAESPDVARALQKSAGAARELEENSALFGEPAGSAAEASKRLADLGEAREALRVRLDEGDFFSRLGTDAGEATERALDTYLERLGAVLRSSDGPAAKVGRETVERVQSLRQGPLRTLAGGNQADALRRFAPSRVEPSIARDVLGEVAETAAEVALPGFGLARKAWKYRKHVLRLAGGARKGAETAAERMLAPVGKAAGKGTRALARAATPLAARNVGSFDEAQFHRVQNAIDVVYREPERLSDYLAENLGDIPEEAPELLEAVAVRADRAVQFLKAKMPPAFEFSLLYPDGPPASRSDVIQLGLYWRGITQPHEVVAAIGDGSAMPEEVEAFRAVNPAWFTELQEALQTRIVAKNQAGEVVPGYRVAQLEGLLDLPGKLDPTFSDAVAGIAQAVAQQMQEAQRAPSYVPIPRAGARTQPESLERIQL